eukprot:CAMPEP_0184482400 /NCGR_PEP_ID=MMETSP0113_2-20130426/3954_1 /TAXON_ID=91329 /ORGANISM="Norrisiella sphaerica, Strain BC52" /LENGTH=492 /DNA_ID=CAMNT_0026862101 /DNA_START=35 /DNA_END=1513 /DNA_ORIENTATION=+
MQHPKGVIVSKRVKLGLGLGLGLALALSLSLVAVTFANGPRAELNQELGVSLGVASRLAPSPIDRHKVGNPRGFQPSPVFSRTHSLRDISVRDAAGLAPVREAEKGLTSGKSQIRPEELVRRVVDESYQNRSPLKVTIIGSGNWGSAIATVVGQNTKKYPVFANRTTMWVFQEIYEGRNLTDIINEDHENKKYLPDISLPDSVFAEPDLVRAASDADVLIFVTPHQFVRGICETLKGVVKPEAIGVSLIKGFEVREKEGKSEINLMSEVIEDILGIQCAALSGANVAHDIANRQFSESTIGCRQDKDAGVLQLLFDVPYFKIGMVKDVEGVQIYGSLKNIVAVAAGFVDGLGLDSNTKAAIIRMGVEEMRKFTKMFYPEVLRTTMWDSCGIADVITTCFGGRNRKCAERFVQERTESWADIEQKLLQGQKLQGVLTAEEVHEFLASSGNVEEFPFFNQVHQICQRKAAPETIIDTFMVEDLKPFSIEGIKPK